MNSCPPNPTAYRLKVRIQNWIYSLASLLLFHYILYEWLWFNQRQLKYLYSYLPPVFITDTPPFFNCFYLQRQFLGHDWNLCQIQYFVHSFDIIIFLGIRYIYRSTQDKSYNCIIRIIFAQILNLNPKKRFLKLQLLYAL